MIPGKRQLNQYLELKKILKVLSILNPLAYRCSSYFVWKLKTDVFLFYLNKVELVSEMCNKTFF